MDITGNDQIAEVYFNRGNAKSDIQDFAGAIADFTEAIRLNIRYASAYFDGLFLLLS